MIMASRCIRVVITGAKSDNWLPTGNQNQLYLALRLYNPQPAVYENPAGVELPRIIKGECR